MEDEFLVRYLPGQSPEMKALRHAIFLANQPAALSLRQPLLLLGESGVGKGYTAEIAAAHRSWITLPPTDRGVYLGRPALRPIVGLGETNNIARPTMRRGDLYKALTLARYASVLLPGIPEALLETELFGHKKGAFTGASGDRDGLFKSDVITDLLLDEIGDAGLPLQSKLLEVIENGTFRPVGARIEDKHESHIRPLLATNKNLAQLVREGSFREDLYWRVSQLVGVIPPLRAQKDTMPELMMNVRDKIVSSLDASTQRALRPRDISAEDVSWAQRYSWPGNIRELTRLTRLWLMHPAQTSIESVHQSLPIENPWASRPASLLNAEQQLRSAVAAWCAELRAGVRRPPGNVDHLLRDILAVVKRELAGDGLTNADYELLFADQNDANVRSRLSKWRRGDTP